jgi:hypothetical protein
LVNATVLFYRDKHHNHQKRDVLHVILLCGEVSYSKVKGAT